MDSIMRTAGALLGTRLSDPVDLGGSRRSTVLRCATADGGSVVVKAFTDEPEALRAFTAEAAGLSLALAGPDLLAVAADPPLLVMADLGSAPTLADVLLASDAEAAERGLSAWARGLGRLAAGSVHRRADLHALWARYDKGMPSWDAEPWIPGNAAALAGVVGTAGVTVPPGLAADLDRIGTAGGDTYGAFTPGDTCPDNNLITPQGLRLIDFEAACYQSVFLTAAYCSMPFSTCWCVFRLPAGMGETLEEVYRREVVDAYPELAEDAVWRAGMQQALAVWTVDATVRLLPRAATEDLPMHRTRRPVPTMRQVLLHRWEAAGRLTGYPAFADTFRRLLRRTAAAWDVPPLPHYPAFTAPGPGPVSGPGPASAR